MSTSNVIGPDTDPAWPLGRRTPRKGRLGSEANPNVPYPAVLGVAALTADGDTVLRVGRPMDANPMAWRQTETVLLSAEDREALIAALVAHRGDQRRPAGWIVADPSRGDGRIHPDWNDEVHPTEAAGYADLAEAHGRGDMDLTGYRLYELRLVSGQEVQAP